MTTKIADEIAEVCLSVPGDLMHRRIRTKRALDALAVGSAVQIVAIAMFGLLLQLQ